MPEKVGSMPASKSMIATAFDSLGAVLAVFIVYSYNCSRYVRVESDVVGTRR